ncbi:MAG: hypothetical protein NTV62_03370 [Candidatus Gribaldobacteria bacterium]|nr:hypothetical protein [Candidatus Gribaldobacteria bacterium]
MTSKVITVLILVFLGAALIGAVVYDSMTKKAVEEVVLNPVVEVQPAPVEEVPVVNEIVLPSSTGDIDETVASFLQEIDLENNLLLEENSDTGFVTSDNEVLGNIGQSSDDNTL